MDVRYATLTDKNYYWFYVDTYRLNQWRGKQRFVECFICGDENTVVFVPDDKIFEWYDGIEANRKGHWFLKIVPEGERLVMKIGHGRSDIDTREYLNRYDLISPLIPRPVAKLNIASQKTQAEFEEIRSAIMADIQLNGDSLHERVIDMLAQIGDWFDYEVKKPYSVESKSPYAIDIVWLKSGELDLAMEVHDGGNETEAKDRLRQALRFGARKVIIVSIPNAVARLKNVSRFEADLKNWLEIWGIEKVYQMYGNGRKFFDDFRFFRKRQRSDDITEYV